LYPMSRPGGACAVFAYLFVYSRPRPKHFEVYVPYLELAPYVCQILAFDVRNKKKGILQCGKKYPDLRLTIKCRCEKGDPPSASGARPIHIWPLRTLRGLGFEARQEECIRLSARLYILYNTTTTAILLLLRRRRRGRSSRRSSSSRILLIF